jgi:protoheme IX farnesyltransferase
MVYTILLVGFSLSPCVFGLMGPVYGVTAGALGAVFLWYAWRVLNDAQDDSGKSLSKDAPAKACFKYSILYLFLLFGACAVDRLV